MDVDLRTVVRNVYEDVASLPGGPVELRWDVGGDPGVKEAFAETGVVLPSWVPAV